MVSETRAPGPPDESDARWWLWPVIVLGGFVGLLSVGYLALKLAPDWFASDPRCPPTGNAAADQDCLDTAKVRADDRRGVTTATLAVFAGGLSMFGAVYTARSFRANRDAAGKKHGLDLEAQAHSQEAAARRHKLDLAAHALDQARQISERFTRAIEQLGSSELDVRRGGIYALERISRDSAADHPHVVEALTAFVRDHAPWPPEHRETATARPRRPPSDIQAAMTVLGRRDISRDSGDVQLRLSAVDLRRVSLRGGHFEGARLRRAHLEGAQLEGVHLQGAKLRDAQLQDADLGPDSELELPGANLEGASVHGADFTGAKLKGARFSGIDYDEDTNWPGNRPPEDAPAL